MGEAAETWELEAQEPECTIENLDFFCDGLTDEDWKFGSD